MPIEHQFTTQTDGFVSLMGRLTPFVSNTSMALVANCEVLGSRKLDMGNSAIEESGIQSDYRISFGAVL